MFRICVVIVLALLISSCSGGGTSSTTSTTTSVAVTTTSQVTTPVPTVPPTTTSTVVPTAVPSTTPAGTTSIPATTTSVQPTTQPGTSTTIPVHGTAKFDFDTGSPSPTPRQTLTPFDQTSGALTAHFSSPYDPYSFSVQNNGTTFLKLAQLSGNYLYPNQINRATLIIRFSQPVTSIALTFATVDSHDPGNVEQPTDIKLSAYVNTFGTAPVGSETARGVFSSDAYPQGNISFASATSPFNVVVIEIVVQPTAGTGMLFDNILVSY